MNLSDFPKLLCWRSIAFIGICMTILALFLLSLPAFAFTPSGEELKQAADASTDTDIEEEQRPTPESDSPLTTAEVLIHFRTGGAKTVHQVNYFDAILSFNGSRRMAVGKPESIAIQSYVRCEVPIDDRGFTVVRVTAQSAIDDRNGNSLFPLTCATTLKAGDRTKITFAVDPSSWAPQNDCESAYVEYPDTWPTEDELSFRSSENTTTNNGIVCTW